MTAPLTIDDMIARYPGTNRQSWANIRYTGNGPAYFKVGRKVFYRTEDVAAWEESQRRTRTDEQVA
ncbi:hypothetical protein [Corynebacterium pacaense]|uniref:hypothetical protein n=1 Tax=Corynebacterium pacaense TaxID=1816684 RepID=UPI0009B95E56|nr:hypothetical protein [Corynebacterium pacaense]